VPYVPYKYNPAEMPAEDLEATFVGRCHLLDHLVAAVREQTDTGSIQHYLLLGPRGIGKTTLLLMLYRRVKEDPELSGCWFPVRYREEEFYVYTLRDLLALALEHLHEEEGVPEAEVIRHEAEAEADDERSLAKLLGGLRKITKSYGKRLLLLIDNFDQLFPGRAANDLDQHAFRKLLSTEPFLMVVGTSTLLFEDIFSYDEAFFNFFSPVPVEDLCDEEIQDLLYRRAQLDENQDFLREYEKHKEKVRAITYLTGGNPRLVMMLYEILSQRQFLPVVQTLRETIDNLTPLLKDVLEDLPRQQSKVLDALMRLGGTASPSGIAKCARLPLNVVTTQMGRLKEARLVEVQGEGRGKPAVCRVSDQMFRTWYQMRYLRPARRRVELFVEFLRAWFTVEDNKESKTDEAKNWIARIDELEPEGTPLEQRLEARIGTVVTVARTCSLDTATALLDTLLNTAPSDLRERLAFLKPGLIFAQSGDESTLAKLPQEEQEMARRIAATVKKGERKGSNDAG
jgi:DNA polymerase III delta prime subunit